MGCPACGHAAPEKAKFCAECGAALARRCAQCRSELPPGAKFCAECGAPQAATTAPAVAALERTPRAYTPKHLADKILASRAALEGERKQVTVLFADVRGSMELAEQVDAEQWHAILDRFFAILTDGVHRFEGTVNQYTGDGIMALFGAPLAHEDHAQRACYAALHLRDALRNFAQELRRTRGLDFATRIGINSGEVVVGKIGDDLRMDYTAQGHTVGLAQRMESLAEAGRIYLTAATAQLAHGYFSLADLGEFRVKGASEPVRVHELLGAGALRTRFDLSRARGLSRFVGRAGEVATLEAALERAAAGHGSVVGVVAEAGTGKSRLCFELAESARARGFAVREAHGVPHGKQVALLPVLALLRGLFGIAERDGDAEVRQKIAGALVLLDASFERVLPIWFEFLGAPDPARPAPALEPADRERLVLEGLRRLVRARSERGPALLLLEDLHWFDAASEKVLATLVDAVRDTRTLLLLNFRPEFRADWMQRSDYQQLPLRPLGPEAIAGLLVDLLGAHASVAALAQRIAQHAGGNPFFVEELVQALVETGALSGTRGSHQATREVASLALPATVQAVLAARIDRLAEREKHVLHTAAVLGPEFEATLLARVAELPEPALMDALRALAQAELVLERSLYPEVVFAFKHPLTQEVALRTQLGSRRAERHAAAARAIEATTPANKLDERSALLAHHWEEAGEKLLAARAHMRASVAAAFRTPVARIEHAESALRLCQAVPESEETLALSLDAYAPLVSSGLVFGTPTAEVRHLVNAARAASRRIARSGAFADVLLAFAMHRAVIDVDYDEAFALVDEASELARRSGDDLQLARALVNRLIAQRQAGHLAEAAATVEELEHLRLPPGESIQHAYLSHIVPANRGRLRFLLGRLDEANQEIGAAIESADRVRQPSVVWPWFREELAEFRGDVAGAERDALLSLRNGSPEITNDQRVISLALGIAHALKREWTEAASSFERSLSLGSDSHGIPARLAEARLELGDFPRAREITSIAADYAQRRMHMYELSAQLAVARILVRSDGLAARGAIEAALARAAELIASTGARVHAPLLHLARASFAQLLGDAPARERELREAKQLFAEMGAPLRVAEIERELAAAAAQREEKRG